MSEVSPVRLSEYETSEWQLDPIDRHYLATDLASRFSLTKQLIGEQIFDVIAPGPTVGVLTLPSGRRLEATPKIEAANVFYMLAMAYELPGFLPQEAQCDSLDQVFDFIVQRFADLAEERLRQGLYRRYVEQQENLSRLRGRIVFARDIPLNFALRHRIYCEYDELSWDVLENQVVRQVAAQLSHWPLRRDLRARLASIDAVMGEVRSTAFDSSVLDHVSYNRLNDAYRPLHALCRLLMQARSLDEDEGATPFLSFLIDMNKLFEDFIAQVLKAELEPAIEVRLQKNSHLDLANQVAITPDIVLQQRGRVLGVVDTKYKRLAEGEFKHHDLYQVVSYGLALHCPRAMLIYPRHFVDVDRRVDIRNSPIHVEQVTVPIGGELAQLRGQLVAFATRVRDWALATEPASSLAVESR